MFIVVDSGLIAKIISGCIDQRLCCALLYTVTKKIKIKINKIQSILTSKHIICIKMILVIIVLYLTSHSYQNY